MAREFQVGEWLIEPDLNRVSNAGKITPVEPKVIEVLVCLAHHPGEVLSKEQIVKAVWPDTYVGEGTLSYSISELRRAFCDDAKNPRIIETIPRKGYRLIASVAYLTPTFKSQPSIAVLPFSDISLEKDQEYFCDGIAEEIINDLAHVRGLRVAARTSSFACQYFYRSKRKSIECALEMFSRATIRDPGYALAFAGMADCYSYLFRK